MSISRRNGLVQEIKPTHKVVQAYYGSLKKFEKLGVKHEGAVRSCFQALLEHCASQIGHVFIPEYQLTRKGAVPLEPDGAVVDSLSQILRYGLWEAKDTDKHHRAAIAGGGIMSGHSFRVDG